MNAKVYVWSVVENSRRRFGVGRCPRNAEIVGEWHKPYDPNTGTTSEQWSYWPYHHHEQPAGKWLHERMPA